MIPVKYAAILFVRENEACLGAIDALFETHQGAVPLPALRRSLTDVLGIDPVLPCAVQGDLPIYRHQQLEALMYPLDKGKVINREVTL